MRILVLGGTAFVGRAIVEDALRTGAEVTLFGRGKTGADLFPQLTLLRGDRDTGDYAALAGRTWDAVVDVCGYVPRHVGQAMDALEPVRYVDDTGELDDSTYGPSKVACEDDVVARYGQRATIVRPGKVAGPHDWQDGLTYWVRRAVRGGRVAVPGDLEQPVQVIDSRDLARLVVQLLADDRPGAFQAVGPAEPVTLGGLIQTCAQVAGTEVELVPVPPDLAPPMFPLVKTDWPAQQRSAARARAAGMPATPLAVTAADVLAWDTERGEPPLTRGFSPEAEQALLAQAGARERRGRL